MGTAVATNMQRLTSIDMLRGLVIVIMALDHVRDMLTPPQPELLDFSSADASLFFTRWITHLCAPTFVLLAGTSAFLYGTKGRSTGEVSRFLLTRGAWLVFIELTIVNFAWNFNLGAQYFPVMQVIWVLGISMIVLAGLIWLPRTLVAGIGIAMIVGHNLLDAIQPATESASAAWLLLHIQGQLYIGETPIIFVAYPMIPWIGVIALGYAIGPIFIANDAGRPRRLLWTGFSLVLAFLAIRAFNFYGEPDPWQSHGTLEATLVDFFNTTKYPPSLQFLLMTLGPTFMLLGLFERIKGRLSEALVVIGRVPFFFYVAHLYLIHFIALGLGLIQGFTIPQIAVIYIFYPPDFGVSLGTVYLAWIAVILVLYPACRWFAGVKARNRSWWLSYL